MFKTEETSNIDESRESALLVFGEEGEGDAEAGLWINGGDLPAQLEPLAVGLFDGEGDELAHLRFAERVYEAAANTQICDARLVLA